MRDELLNESLFFGLDHASSAMAEWADDVHHFRPHSSLGYQAPADYAGSIAATGSNAAQDESFAFPSVAPAVPLGVVRIDQNRRGSSRSWMRFSGRSLGFRLRYRFRWHSTDVAGGVEKAVCFGGVKRRKPSPLGRLLDLAAEA